MSDGVDLSPYRIAYHVDLQNTPAWFEQRRPRTGTSRSHTSNILSERLAERVWYPKSQSSLLNIYFLISGFSSSLLLIYLLRGLSQTVEPKPFRYAASLLYRNHACRNRPSYVWTNALSDVLLVPARELWSSIPPEQIMKSNLVYSCYFSEECCQSFLSLVTRNPYT